MIHFDSKRNGIKYVVIKNIWCVIKNGEEFFIKDQDKPLRVLLDLDYSPHRLNHLMGILKLSKRKLVFYSFDHDIVIERFKDIGEIKLAKGYRSSSITLRDNGGPNYMRDLSDINKKVSDNKRTIHKLFEADELVGGEPHELLAMSNAVNGDILLNRDNFSNLYDIRTSTIIDAGGPGGQISKAEEIARYALTIDKKDVMLLDAAFSANAILFTLDIWKNRYVLPESRLVFHEPKIALSNIHKYKDYQMFSDIPVKSKFKKVDVYKDFVITGEELIKDYGCKPIDNEFITKLIKTHIKNVEIYNKLRRN